MRIALIDASKRSALYPVSLLKIGAYLQDKGHTVNLFRRDTFSTPIYDEVYISTLFTFEIPHVISIIKQVTKQCDIVRVGGVSASLMPYIYKRYTPHVHIGLLTEAEGFPPDYSLLEETPRYSITHTSRGCARKCGFCMVPKIEPKFFARSNWMDDCHPKSKKILFYDNNFLVKPVKELAGDVEKILHLIQTTDNKKVDFNQALDCRLLTDEKAMLLAKLPHIYCRFAFDGMQEDGFLQAAIKKMASYGVHNFTVFCLYNFEDTPADFYYRMRTCVSLSESLHVSIAIFPMRYQPILSIDAKRTYVGIHWTQQTRSGFMNILNKQSVSGQISFSKVTDFEFYFGKSGEEFLQLISFTDISLLTQRKKGRMRELREKK